MSTTTPTSSTDAAGAAGTPEELALLRLSAAAERMGEVMQGLPALLEDELHISRARLYAIGVLERGPASHSDLAAATMTSPSACSRLVSGMVDDGLVARERDAEDRRVVHVVLTDAGRELTARLQARMGELFGEVIARVGVERTSEAADALEELLGAMADAIVEAHDAL